jgi:phage-related tail fiber protein
MRNIVRFTSAPSAVKWRKTDNSGDLGMSLNSSNHLAMDAIIDFAAGQTFGAFSYPDATTTSKGIVQIDPVGGLAVMAGVLSLANTAVTPGTYPKLTVDAKGRATAGAALVAGDLPAHTHVATDIVSGALPFTIQKAGTAIGTRRAARLRITCSPRRIRTPWPPRPSWAT